MTTFVKEVSEQIGAVDRDTDIVVSKTNIWETPSSALLIQISACDVTTDWSSNYGPLSIDTADKKEGTGSLKDTVAAPEINHYYGTIYSRPGSWDWSGKEDVLLWVKSDRASSAFSWTHVYVRDTSGNGKYWDIDFSAGEWTAIKISLSAGTVEVGGDPPDFALVDKVMVYFKAADETPFYKKIDDLRVITPTIWEDNKILQEQEDE